MRPHALIWAALALPAGAAAQEARGFFEVRGQASVGVDGDWWQVVERLRPELEAEIVERVVIAVTVEAALAQGRDLATELERTLRCSDLGPLLEAGSCTWPSHDNEPLRISDAGDYLSVERLHLDVYLPWMDLRVGRQAVNWGSALLVNPTDPFPEVLTTEPWRYRAGVNAVRATFPIGEDHDAQLVVGGNDDLTAMRVAARGRVGFGLADLSLVGAWRQEARDGFVGLDLRGTLEVGYWLEGAVFVDYDHAVHEELAVGLDYSFPLLDALVVALQYYRNGGGTGAAGRIPGAEGLAPTCAAGVSPLPATEPDPFAPVFTGTDYGLLTVSLAAMPELTITALWLQNLGDGSGMVVPTVVAYPLGWLEVALAAQVPFTLVGEGGELHPSDEELMPALGPVTVDLRGLAPDATFTLWTRAHF